MNTKEEVRRADVSSCCRLSGAGKKKKLLWPTWKQDKIVSSIFSHLCFSSRLSSGGRLAGGLIKKIKLYRSPEKALAHLALWQKTTASLFLQVLILRSTSVFSEIRVEIAIERVFLTISYLFWYQVDINLMIKCNVKKKMQIIWDYI